MMTDSIWSLQQIIIYDARREKVFRCRHFHIKQVLNHEFIKFLSIYFTVWFPVVNISRWCRLIFGPVEEIWSAMAEVWQFQQLALYTTLDMSERLSFLVLSFLVLLRKQASSFLVLLLVGVVLVEHQIWAGYDMIRPAR